MLRFRLVVLVAVCALATAALAGCASRASNGTSLEAHEWKVTKLAGAGYQGQADITAKFMAGAISGSTGVNRYSGTYDAPKANSIAITLGPMTLIAGTPEASQAEADYLAALKSAASYAVDDTSLTFFDASGVATVEFAIYVPTALRDSTGAAMAGYRAK